MSVKGLKASISKFPRLKSALKRVRSVVTGGGNISAGYRQLETEEAEREGVRLREAWKSNDLPNKQRDLVEKQIKKYRVGEAIDVFDTLVASLRGLPIKLDGASVLEIGCSSGFYSEVFSIAGLPVAYRGCDYSAPFVDMARKSYPQCEFDIEDAVSLSYSDSQFDVVISGCCLLHIPEYQTAIVECARVAKQYVIFHRTPVVFDAANRYYTKLAYGVETIEIHFSESDFLSIVQRAGLVVLNALVISEDKIDGVGTAVKTYVCRTARPC